MFSNAELARAFENILRAPTHEHIATQRRGTRLKRGEVRMGGAMRERGTREAARGFNQNLNKSSEENIFKCRALSGI